MKKRVIFITFLFIQFFFQTYAQIPHILQNGDVIDAVELNENFNYLLSKLDKIKNPIKANGRTIGDVLGIYPDKIYLKFNPDFLTIAITPGGYLDWMYIVFTEPDCQGKPYAYGFEYFNNENEDHFYFPALMGNVYDVSGDLYYYQKGAQPVLKNIFSKQTKNWLQNIQYEKCENFINSPLPSICYEIFPNDSEITGIETYPFPMSITINDFSNIRSFQ